MPELIYWFDGGGVWAMELAVILAICAVALRLVFDDRSPMWEDTEED